MSTLIDCPMQKDQPWNYKYKQQKKTQIYPHIYTYTYICDNNNQRKRGHWLEGAWRRLDKGTREGLKRKKKEHRNTGSDIILLQFKMFLIKYSTQKIIITSISLLHNFIPPSFLQLFLLSLPQVLKFLLY